MKPLATIYDIDGVLCDSRSLHPLSAAGDYVAWREGAKSCPAFRSQTMGLKSALAYGVKVIFATARHEVMRADTVEWLRGIFAGGYYSWEVSDDQWLMLMRADGDLRPDVEVKRDWVPSLLERFEINAALDDQRAIVDMYLSFGIPATWIESHS